MGIQQIISFIESTFPICVGNVGLDDDGNVSWSVESTDEDLSDRLISLEPFFNRCGYRLLIQDDNEYFGGRLSKI